jgi:glycosyltransferase involved in cell wall biosynthesis
MACGLPVIASINAGASEHIRDNETGFVLRDPFDAGEIARLIRFLFDDSALRQRLGHAASEYVQANAVGIKMRKRRDNF